MPLNKDAMATKLKNLFEAAALDETGATYTKEKMAQELASIIDAYVREAGIKDVKVTVKDNAGTTIGNGTQNNTAKLV